MKKVSFFLFFAVILGVGFTVQRAQALPYDATLISKAGLQWLSPVWSQGISYDHMITYLSSSGNDYSGLRYATLDEAHSLFEAYAAPYSSDPNWSRPGTQGAMDLISDFRFTYLSSGWGPEISGIVGDAFPTDASKRIVLILTPGYGDDPSQPFYEAVERALPNNSGGSYLDAGYFWGSWLVVDATPVPEPATILLLGTGLIGLLKLQRKRLGIH
jgi:hypothetical protein